MNYYIDFDNTLYETAKLTTLILEKIEKYITEKAGVTKEEVSKYFDNNFDSTTAQIYSFTEQIAKDFKISAEELVNEVKKIIAHGEKIVFEDAKRFLKKIKENGDKVIIVTYIPNKNNFEYQMQKLTGAGILEYCDTIVITSNLKATLELDYKNGIVIDDDPRDLTQLYEKNPIRLIRIRKPNNKRSLKDMDNKDIEEYECFDDIKL